MLVNVVFLFSSYLAAIVATLAGFGSSTILIPIALFFMNAKAAIFLVACFHLFSNTFKVRLFFKGIDFRTVLFFGLPSIIFAFLGAVWISVLPVHVIRNAIGIFLIVFSLYSFFRPDFKLKQTDLTALLGGTLSGLLAGLIGLGGAIRSTFLVAFNLPKEVYIGTSALIAFVIDLTRIPTYFFTGMAPENSYYPLIPFLILSAFLGVKTGKLLLGRVNQQTFRRIVLFMLLIVGIMLLGVVSR